MLGHVPWLPWLELSTMVPIRSCLGSGGTLQDVYCLDMNNLDIAFILTTPKGFGNPSNYKVRSSCLAARRHYLHLVGPSSALADIECRIGVHRRAFGAGLVRLMFADLIGGVGLGRLE